ncbi:MAG: outer membrane lipoprotein carrier protein LolA [Bacteroidales bacterium]|jgi:outer membrane lipoprotein-sorting protein|nr:outer membrane lipoprotein carrier protein LolA [Bacteroidales bacterium]
MLESKRYLLLSIFFMGFLGIMCGQNKPASTSKNIDNEANTILKNVQAKVSSYTTIFIDFTVHTIQKEKVVEEFSGKIRVKGKKYILETEDQIIYCNAVNVWNYLPQQEEVTLSMYDSTEQSQFVNPALLIKDFQKQFSAKFIREETQKGTLVQIIDLTPLQSAAYYKIRLFINKSKQQITQTTIYQRDGVSYTYFVDKFVVNQAIDDKQFMFDKSKYPSIELIDLR